MEQIRGCYTISSIKNGLKMHRSYSKWGYIFLKYKRGLGFEPRGE